MENKFIAVCRQRLGGEETAQTVIALQDFLAQYPENEEGWRLLAEGVATLGDARLAAETVDGAARQLGSLSLAGDAYARWERLGEARRGRDLLRDFVINDRGDLALYRRLAENDIAAGRIADAHACLEKALAVSPNDETLFGDYVGLAVLLGKPGRALSYWPRFANKSRNATVLINMAVLFLRNGDLDSALRLLGRVKERRHPMLHINLAEIAFRRGRFSEAADAYLRAHQLGKSEPEMTCLALLFAGREHDARSWLPSLSPAFAPVILCLLEDGLRLRALLPFPPHSPREKKWLEELAKLRRKCPDLAGRMAELHLLRAWRFLLPAEKLPPLDFLCESFPPTSFIELACAVTHHLVSVLEMYFDCFSVEARAQLRRTDEIERLFEAYFLPAIQELLKRKLPGRAALLARWSYPFLKAEPTPERFELWARRQAGFLAPWTHPQIAAAPPCSLAMPLRIAYIIEHFMHDEAPDHTLFGLTTALRRHGGALPFVFACHGASETIAARFAEEGVEISACPIREEDDFSGRLAWLIAELRRRAIDVVVFYGTTPAFCGLFAPSLPAAAILFESVAHTGLELPCLDGYLRSTAPVDAFSQIIGQAEWWFYQNSIPMHTPTLRQRQDAKSIRARFGSCPVLGAIARAAKLTDEFLDTVAAILGARPSAVFVWTDFLPDRHVLAKLRQRGIEKQCHYAGYVDYVTWADVLDIHLDPFPFASGLTMRQTWHRGRAYVMMRSRYRSLDGQEKTNALALSDCSIEPLFALPADHPARQRAEDIFGGDRSRLAIADSTSAYVDWAIRLIDDLDLRAAVGAAAQAYSDAFLTNMAAVAETYLAGLRHFLRKKYGPTIC